MAGFSSSGIRLLRLGAPTVLLALILLTAPGVGAAERTEDEEFFTPHLAYQRTPAPEQDLAALGTPSDPDANLLAERIRTGVLLIKHGQYAQAATVLEPHRDQSNFTLLHALGVAYVRLNKNPEALAILKRAHELRPTVAGPLLPAALACVRMSRQCYEYRELALEYKERGGRFKRFADKIAYHVPLALRRS
jgi:Flp pilus assembly protein TadD